MKKELERVLKEKENQLQNSHLGQYHSFKDAIIRLDSSVNISEHLSPKPGTGELRLKPALSWDAK